MKVAISGGSGRRATASAAGFKEPISMATVGW
jgi:hypothetical protein